MKKFVIHQSLHIDKIHKNNNSFLIIPTLAHNSADVNTDINFQSQRKENRAKFPLHRKHFSQRQYIEAIKSLLKEDCKFVSFNSDLEDRNSNVKFRST